MRAEGPLERVRGCLWGCALGDALGLPMEGLSSAVIAGRFGELDRFHLVGRTGFVSDDTEQTALLALSIAEAPGDAQIVSRFRRHLRWWFARLPFGVGFATLRSCLKLWLGFSRPGVISAGNGAAMRSAILGATIQDPRRRATVGQALAELTHRHPLAVEGALYVAELAAACARSPSHTSRTALVDLARTVLAEPLLRSAVERALETGEDPAAAARALGNTGYVVHSVGLTTWAFARGTSVLDSLRLAIRAGGDTDTHAAIVGAWTGTLHGDHAIPAALLAQIHDGPFGPAHLDGLARAVCEGTALPRWSALAALGRNLALFPVVLAHGLRRLVPLG